MADTASTAQTKGSYKYACGTPREECGGSTSGTSKSLSMGGQGMRLHQTSEQAFNCCKRFLLRTGWTQNDSRSFAPPRGPNGEPLLKHPDGEPLIENRILTKKSRFGSKLRPGKAGRNMSSVHTGGIVIVK